ncbi:MAG: hypothetical protein HBSAPP03_10600 [Phycisphaerae bacterium]|nr:MAG: hypothetical protein HBSAPP03_10600 [Phycisphaerae bacterium]
MKLRSLAGLVGLGMASLAAAFPIGADVKLGDIQSISNHGVVGGVYGYMIGSHTCNVGTANLTWANNGTPGLAGNAYRLSDGRLVQIGLSFAKTACCAAAGTSSMCAVSCNGQGGSVLGVGCLDVYSSGWNSGQGRLAQRSAINAWTGAYGTYSTATGSAIFKQIQVPAAQIGTANFPNALYFVEGVYVATDDAAGMKHNNNATYKRVTINASNAMALTGSPTNEPAIKAWRANGLGAGIMDPSVIDGVLDVPGEGRFHTAYKVTNLGGGQYRYDYAVYNLSSDRSGGSFVVPVPNGVTVTNMGFNAPLYHSNEVYSNDPWTMTRGCTTVEFRSPQTFAQNANTNALRWGTMYNFWFEANFPPAAGTASIGLFKPGTPTSLDMPASVPSGPACTADVNCDGAANGNDVEAMERAVGGDMSDYFLADPDFNGDGAVNGNDVEAVESVVGGGPCP